LYGELEQFWFVQFAVTFYDLSFLLARFLLGRALLLR
jgi:hypothetical protein